MELIPISDRRLKIMLNAEDMTHYALHADTVDSGSAAARHAVWQILEEARVQIGFDATGARIFVQLFPERKGGCELFITRLSDPPAEIAYRFSCLSHLLLACRRLHGTRQITVSRAWVDEERRYFYLLIDQAIPALAEYEAVACTEKERHYILEHCRCFCRDAIPTLAPLA